MTYDPIKIRYKTLKNGNRSIYLDYRVDGKRVVEYVKMYLLPGRSPQVRHNINLPLLNITFIMRKWIILFIKDKKRSLTKCKTPVSKVSYTLL